MSRLLTSEAETLAAGRALGAAAHPGAVILLHGTLGAGKTLFTRGIGQGLGLTSRVQSPTFVIVQAHEGGRHPLWHADLYRLGDPSELRALDLDALLAEGGVLVVEWPERGADELPAGHLDIFLDLPEDPAAPDSHRRLSWRATDAAHQALGGALDR